MIARDTRHGVSILGQSQVNPQTKHCFDALVQYRIESLTVGLTRMSEEMTNTIRRVRNEPSASLHDLMQLPEFDELVTCILRCEAGSDGGLTLNY